MNKKKLVIIFVVIIVALLIVIANLFEDVRSLRWSLTDYRSIPRIELTNTLTYSSEHSSFYGLAKGFVKFDNIEDQPKDLTQYYIIQPLNEFDENSNQIFNVNDIVAMNNLAPRSLGIEKFTKIVDTSSGVVLEDKYGNRILISKISKEISMKDASGDKTTLITDESEYRDFMKDFLK